LLEFPDRRLGNLLGDLAEDFAGLGGAGPCQRADQLSWRLIPEDELPVGNVLEIDRQFAQLIRTSSARSPINDLDGDLSGQAEGIGAGRSKGSDGLSRLSGELVDEEVSVGRVAAKSTDNGGKIDSVCSSENDASFC